MSARILSLLAAAALLLSACSQSSGGDADENDGLLVVATTSILGDVVSQVVGEEGEVVTLLPRGADPHGFAPSASDTELIRDADLVVVNGLDLEEGLVDAIEAAREDGVAVFTASDHVELRPLVEGDGASDPHIWLDPANMAAVVRALGDELGGGLESQAERVAAELDDLDAELAEALAAVPAGDRVLVTNHEALGYFADAYDFEVVATVIPAGTTLAEPSAADLEHVVAVIRETGVGAIFAEITDPGSAAQVVAEEIGRDVIVLDLYTESLSSPGGPAATYQDLMRENARLIVDGLT